jgi:hypothetical protein
VHGGLIRLRVGVVGITPRIFTPSSTPNTPRRLALTGALVSISAVALAQQSSKPGRQLIPQVTLHIMDNNYSYRHAERSIPYPRHLGAKRKFWSVSNRPFSLRFNGRVCPFRTFLSFLLPHLCALKSTDQLLRTIRGILGKEQRDWSTDLLAATRCCLQFSHSQSRFGTESASRGSIVRR